MSYVIHCYDEKAVLAENVKKEELEDAIKVCIDHKEAKFFKVFCSEWTYHLEGAQLKNGNIDWLRVE